MSVIRERYWARLALCSLAAAGLLLAALPARAQEAGPAASSEQAETVCFVDGQGYSTLQQALTACQNQPATVRLAADVALQEGLFISASQSITLDLAGCQVTFDYTRAGNGALLTNYGFFELTDSVGGGALCLRTTGGDAFSLLNYGQISLQQGLVLACAPEGFTACALLNYNQGDVTLTQATLQAQGGAYTYGFYNQGNGSLTMTGGQVIAGQSPSACGIYNQQKGALNLYGGEIQAQGSQFGCGIYCYDQGAVVIGHDQQGPTVAGSHYGLALYGGDQTALLAGGTLSGGTAAWLGENAPAAQSGYRVDLSRNDGRQEARSVALPTYQARVLITLAGVPWQGHGKEVTLQGEGLTLSPTNPQASQLIFMAPEGEYRLLVDGHDIDQKLQVRLGYSNSTTIDFAPVARVGDQVFDSVQQAVNAAGLSAAPVELVLEEDVSLSAPVQVAAGQNLRLDLNGHRLASRPQDGQAVALVNAGTLEIVDTSQEGTGQIIAESADSYSWAVVNASTGALTVTSGQITARSAGLLAYGIYNYAAGAVTVDGGHISASSTAAQDGFGCGLVNAHTGPVIINGGEILGESDFYYGYGLYSYGSGNLWVNGGRITGRSREYSGYGLVFDGAGVLQVNGGRIAGSGKKIGCALYSGQPGGILILGSNDQEVTAAPTLLGSSFGVYKYNDYGSVFFYDGVITGGERAVSGNLTALASSTRMGLVRIEGGAQTARLTYNSQYDLLLLVSLDGAAWPQCPYSFTLGAEDDEGSRPLLIDGEESPLLLPAGQQVLAAAFVTGEDGQPTLAASGQ